MLRPFAIAAMLLTTPAMAGESIVIPAQPYTLKCLKQYPSIESCIIGLVEVSRRLTVQRDQLIDNNKQLGQRITAVTVTGYGGGAVNDGIAAAPVPEPRMKPAPAPAKIMKRSGCNKKWRTLKNGHRKYRCV